jgi:hypothetical protein
MTVPPHRDLPSGRLEARRRHLLAEIRRQPHASLPRPLVLAAGMIAVAAAIAVPLSVGGPSKPRVEVVYRPVRVIVIAPNRSSQLTAQSADLRNASGKKPRTLFERVVAELADEGRHVGVARHAHPAVTRAAALTAMSLTFRRSSVAWLVRLKAGGRERLVWLLAQPRTCIPLYGPTGGVYRATLAGFVDASTGKPLFAITVGGSRPRARC